MSVQSVYLALFGRPADPGGLAYWNEVTNNGVDLSLMLKVLPSLPEYTDRFEGMDNTQIITTIYQNLFGRAPDAEGLAFFTAALANGTQSIATIAVNILDGAQGEDLADVEAKVEAANLFTASLDTPEEIAAYNGNDAAEIARNFLDQVDANNPATEESVNQATGQVVSGGQAPGGGGGGGGGPTIPAVLLDANGIVSIANNAVVSVSESGGNVTFSAPGLRSVTFAKADVSGFDIEAGGLLSAAGGFFDRPFTVEGLGRLNLTGVSTSEATLASLPMANGLKVANIQFVIDADFSDTSGIPTQEVPRLSVDGDMGEGIKVAWIIQDALYRADAAAGTQNGTIETNLLGLEISKQYAAMLNADPSSALVDFLVKVNASGRAQEIHDNLLGNGSEAAISGSRYGATAQDPDARGITPDQVQWLKDAQVDPFSTRPYYDGNPTSSNAAYDAVRAFDWELRIMRNDWLDKASNSTLDASALEGASMWNGDGIGGTSGFAITRHEGAGLELAIRARGRDSAADVTVTAPSGEFEGAYTASGGLNAANTRSLWNFDFSITTGLNGATTNLSDFLFYLDVDIDPTGGEKFARFTLSDVNGDGTFESMVLDPTINAGIVSPAFGTAAPSPYTGLRGFFDNVGTEVSGVDTPDDGIAQNSQNFMFGWIRDLIVANNPGAWNSQNGEFEISLVAQLGTQEIASSDILVTVGTGGANAVFI